jgi:hypothetical protein
VGGRRLKEALCLMVTGSKPSTLIPGCSTPLMRQVLLAPSDELGWVPDYRGRHPFLQQYIADCIKVVGNAAALKDREESAPHVCQNVFFLPRPHMCLGQTFVPTRVTQGIIP